MANGQTKEEFLQLQIKGAGKKKETHRILKYWTQEPEADQAGHRVGFLFLLFCG